MEQDFATFEEETYRIRSLGENSGARETLRPVAKWVMERRTSNKMWKYEAHIFLSNDATAADAKERFGFSVVQTSQEDSPWNS